MNSIVNFIDMDLALTHGQIIGRFFTYQITNIMEITLYLNLTLTLDRLDDTILNADKT